MKLSIGKKITSGFALALAVLVAISLVSYRNIKELNADARWVTHTVEALQRLESLSAGMMQAQGAARGYVLAPAASFQEIFKSASSDITREAQALRNLTADNPNQQQRLDKLDPAIAGRLDMLRKLMDLSSSTATDKEAQVTTIVLEGQEKTDEIRQLISEMEDEERGLLGMRQKRADSTVQLTSSAITYGTLLAFLVVGGIGLLITRSITSPLQVLRDGAAKIGGGEYNHRVSVHSRDEVGELATVFNKMAGQVQERQASLAEQDWLKNQFDQILRTISGATRFGDCLPDNFE